MKQFKYLYITTIFLFFIAGCAKRNFFPDTDDPGLSLLTSHGYNVASNYINGQPYVNPFGFLNGNSLPFLEKIVTNNALDTLSLSWPIELNSSSQVNNSMYQRIFLLIPIPKSFTQNDFSSMSGTRLLNTNTVQIQSYFNYPGISSGNANVYFVKIGADILNNSKYIKISGLFDGNIGDSILITKGRFDFEINADNLNF